MEKIEDADKIIFYSYLITMSIFAFIQVLKYFNILPIQTEAPMFVTKLKEIIDLYIKF